MFFLNCRNNYGVHKWGSMGSTKGTYRHAINVWPRRDAGTFLWRASSRQWVWISHERLAPGRELLSRKPHELIFLYHSFCFLTFLVIFWSAYITSCSLSVSSINVLEPRISEFFYWFFMAISVFNIYTMYYMFITKWFHQHGYHKNMRSI